MVRFFFFIGTRQLYLISCHNYPRRSFCLVLLQKTLIGPAILTFKWSSSKWRHESLDLKYLQSILHKWHIYKMNLKNNTKGFHLLLPTGLTGSEGISLACFQSEGMVHTNLLQGLPCQTSSSALSQMDT